MTDSLVADVLETGTTAATVVPGAPRISNGIETVLLAVVAGAGDGVGVGLGVGTGLGGTAAAAVPAAAAVLTCRTALGAERLPVASTARTVMA